MSGERLAALELEHRLALREQQLESARRENARLRNALVCIVTVTDDRLGSISAGDAGDVQEHQWLTDLKRLVRSAL